MTLVSLGDGLKTTPSPLFVACARSQRLSLRLDSDYKSNWAVELYDRRALHRIESGSRRVLPASCSYGLEAHLSSCSAVLSRTISPSECRLEEHGCVLDWRVLESMLRYKFLRVQNQIRNASCTVDTNRPFVLRIISLASLLVWKRPIDLRKECIEPHHAAQRQKVVSKRAEEGGGLRCSWGGVWSHETHCNQPAYATENTRSSEISRMMCGTVRALWNLPLDHQACNVAQRR